jgi:hypothetical protein
MKTPLLLCACDPLSVADGATGIIWMESIKP